MRALIVYESMFGNTEKVARAIADELGNTFDVTVTEANSKPRAYGMDLLVIGGPTHAFGMSRPASRDQAVQRGAAPAEVAGIGVREYLEASPPLPGMAAAAFDTKIGKSFLSGAAAPKIQRRLRRLGCRIVRPAQSFLVTDTAGPLAAGEEEHARTWASAVAAAVAPERHGVRQPPR
jgi:hypothetical protein